MQTDIGSEEVVRAGVVAHVEVVVVIAVRTGAQHRAVHRYAVAAHTPGPLAAVDEDV